jgi:hypothetical protein
MNSADDEHALVYFDLADSFGNQLAIRCRNLTRLQRASKGSRKSTGGSRHYIVQGCGMVLECSGR